MRSSVDLPQPDGPTSTRNSPSAMARSMSASTRAVAVALVQPVDAQVRHGERALFDRAGGEAGDELAGEDHVDRDDRQDRHRQRREHASSSR